jgi:MFS transporter, PAT family, beta-lactamase induction signal transducer AmpG
VTAKRPGPPHPAPHLVSLEFAPEGASPSDAPPSARVALPVAAWVTSLYFAEGFPAAIVNSIPEVFFNEMGVGLGAIGLTALFHLPWNLKFLWAPLVDLWGKKRAWIVTVEAGLAVLLVALALLAERPDSLVWMSGLFLAMAVVSATHDIAIDGHYLEELTVPEQTRHVGLQSMSYKVASVLARGPLLVLAHWSSWRVAFLAMAGLMVALSGFHWRALQARNLRSEPPHSILRLKGRSGFADGWLSLLRRPGTGWALAFVVSFRLGESLLQKMRWPFLNSAFAMTKADYGVVAGTFGVILALAGTWMGGRAIARFGLPRCLWPCLLAQNGLNLLYAALAGAGLGVAPRWASSAVVLLDEFGSGLGTAVLMVFIMRMCRGERRATEYALVTALMSVGFTFAGALSGFLAQHLGYALFFASTFALAVPMMLLAPKAIRSVPAASMD